MKHIDGGYYVQTAEQAKDGGFSWRKLVAVATLAAGAVFAGSGIAQADSGRYEDGSRAVTRGSVENVHHVWGSVASYDVVKGMRVSSVHVAAHSKGDAMAVRVNGRKPMATKAKSARGGGHYYEVIIRDGGRLADACASGGTVRVKGSSVPCSGGGWHRV